MPPAWGFPEHCLPPGCGAGGDVDAIFSGTEGGIVSNNDITCQVILF